MWILSVLREPEYFGFWGDLNIKLEMNVKYDEQTSKHNTYWGFLVTNIELNILSIFHYH